MVLLCWLVNMTGAVFGLALMKQIEFKDDHCWAWHGETEQALLSLSKLGNQTALLEKEAEKGIYTYIRGIRHHPASTVFQFSFDSQNPRGFDPQDGLMAMAKDSSLNRCLKVKSMLNEFLLKKLTWFICLVTMVEINASTCCFRFLDSAGLHQQFNRRSWRQIVANKKHIWLESTPFSTKNIQNS